MRWEVGGSLKREWTYVYLWLIHVDVWQKPTQYCKAVILQLKINFLKKFCIHFAMLVIISVIWSFKGPKSPTNSILKIISFDLGISEKKNIHVYMVGCPWK